MKTLLFRITVLFLILISFGKTAAFAAISIEANVDKAEATMEDSIELSLTISGISSSPEPQLPDLSAFQIQSSGSSKSIQIINGHMSSKLTYTYYLVPKRVGTFNIGSAVLRYDGKEYRSRPFTVKISKLQASASGNNEQLFIKTSISNPEPYLNEQIIYTFVFFRRVDVTNPQLSLPQFDHFWKEEIGKQKEYRKVVNGQTFIVTEIQYALFPTKAGKQFIDPASLQVDVIYRRSRRGGRRDFFNDIFNQRNTTKRKILRSDAVEINVLPLPVTGKPKEFADIVGELSISSELSKKEIIQGETTTLTTTISGYGNVKDIKIRNSGINKEDFKIYNDKPEFIKEVHNGRLFGRKVIKKSLVPLKSGILEIATPEISYFNTKTKKYSMLRTPHFQVLVTPSKEKEKLQITKLTGLQDSGSRVQVLATDLLDIHTDIDNFSDKRIDSIKLSLYVALFFLPVFSFCFVSYFFKKSKRYKEDRAYARHSLAYKNTLKKLKTTSHLVQDNNYQEFYKDLSKVLREYIGDKLNMEGAAFTPVDVEQKLQQKDFETESTETIKHILEKCEMAQYGISGTLNDDLEEQLNKVKILLTKMEKQL